MQVKMQCNKNWNTESKTSNTIQEKFRIGNTKVKLVQK